MFDAAITNCLEQLLAPIDWTTINDLYYRQVHLEIRSVHQATLNQGLATVHRKTTSFLLVRSSICRYLTHSGPSARWVPPQLLSFDATGNVYGMEQYTTVVRGYYTNLLVHSNRAGRCDQ